MIQRMFIVILLGLTLTFNVRAAAPTWTCVPENYEQSMVITGKIYLQEKVVRKTTCFVGAFINGTCRGSASLLYYPTLDAYIASLMIYGQNADENKELTFKCYEKDADSVYILIDTLKFSANGILGNYAVPFQWGLKVKTALPILQYRTEFFNSTSSSKGILNVSFKEPLAQDAFLSLYSMNGMLVYDALCKKGISDVDVNHIQAGFYMLWVRGQSIDEHLKVLVVY